MNTNFYTHVLNHKGKLLVRSIVDGHRHTEELKYKPYLFQLAEAKHKGKTKFHTLDGRPVTKKTFSSPWDMSKWIKEQEKYGTEIFGLDRPVYTFINDTYIAPEALQYEFSLIRTASIDIEVDNRGMTIQKTVETGDAEITAISLDCFWSGKTYVWGTKDYKTSDPDIVYYQFSNDRDLLEHFIDKWNDLDFDVITGWNIVGFDIPFIINRLELLFGEEYAKRLSPWRVNRNKKLVFFGKESLVPVPAGISVVDYLDLYKKFTYSSQESYKLDWIATLELGIGKVDTSDYKSLYDLYDRNPQLHFDYNVRDAKLIKFLDKKLGFLNQLYSVAYDVGINHEDAMTSVLLWDIIVHNHLTNNKNIVVPHRYGIDENYETIEGGFVKDPRPGLYRWVTSVDLDSLYPHLIMQYNMGPETLIHGKRVPVTVEDLLYGKAREPQIANFLQKNNLSLTATGYMFSNKERSFFAELMHEKYAGRKSIKKKMLGYENRVSEIQMELKEDPFNDVLKSEMTELERQIILLNNLQMALKIQLNSAYGAMANKAFRWFDNRIAESITKSGQLSIRWVAMYFNEHLNSKFGTKDVDYIVAMDTDSMYFSVAKLADKMSGSLQDIATELDKIHSDEFDGVIEAIFNDLANYMNAYEQKMNMKREMIANKVVWTGKKRYLLNIVIGESGLLAEPKLKVKGLESVRSTTPAPIKKKMMECYKIIMDGDEKKLHQTVTKFKEDFRSMDFETIAAPSGVNGINKYDPLAGNYSMDTRFMSESARFGSKCPAQVRGSIVYNRTIKKYGLDNDLPFIYDGDKIRYVYLKLPNPTFEKVIATPSGLPPQLGLEQYIDYDRQFEKLFYDPMKRVTDAIDWTLEETLCLW